MPHAFGTVYREVFLPPVNRAMRILDRNFFQKTIRLASAEIGLITRQPRVKRELSGDVLDAPRIDPWVTAEVYGRQRRLLLLRPGVVFNDPETYSPKITEFVTRGWMNMHPYDLKLDYDHWTFDEILGAALPEELGVPERGFEQLGHIGNMIVEPKFLPYKDFIARVLLDKTPQIKTVVMKQHGGEVNGDPEVIPPMEYITGERNTNVEMAASKMTFKFDFDKCYWDSQMEFPNRILANVIKRKQTVVDVAAGVGHFSIPVAKSKVWVFANDPDRNNYEAMEKNITFNRTTDFCHPFNLPPKEFIPFIIREIAKRSADESTNTVYVPCPHFVQPCKGPPPPGKIKLSYIPHHFIINSRAGGLSALSAFRGAFDGMAFSDVQLPWVHVYIRQPYGQPAKALEEVSDLISKELGNAVARKDIKLELVLKTRPTCLMRASFRLPRIVMIQKPKPTKAEKAEARERYFEEREMKRQEKKMAEEQRRLREEQGGVEGEGEGMNEEKSEVKEEESEEDKEKRRKTKEEREREKAEVKRKRREKKIARGTKVRKGKREREEQTKGVVDRRRMK